MSPRRARSRFAKIEACQPSHKTTVKEQRSPRISPARPLIGPSLFFRIFPGYHFLYLRYEVMMNCFFHVSSVLLKTCFSNEDRDRWIRIRSTNQWHGARHFFVTAARATHIPVGEQRAVICPPRCVVKSSKEHTGSPRSHYPRRASRDCAIRRTTRAYRHSGTSCARRDLLAAAHQ